MEFDLLTTAVVFVIVNALGVGGMIAAEVMPTDTVLMMVAPSMIAFGLLMLGVGVKHGEYRTTR